MATAFDKIAKKKSPAKKKDSIPTAETNEEIQEAVDIVIKNRALMQQLQAENADCESAIITIVREQQDKMAFNGKFHKSFRVPGSKFEDEEGNEIINQLTFVAADKFSTPTEEEDIDRLREICDEHFDEFFETRRKIELNSDVVKDEKILQKIANACKKAGLDINIFEVFDQLVAKKNLDQNQYKLSKQMLEQFRTLVRQNKPSLK